MHLSHDWQSRLDTVCGTRLAQRSVPTADIGAGCVTYASSATLKLLPLPLCGPHASRVCTAYRLFARQMLEQDLQRQAVEAAEAATRRAAAMQVRVTYSDSCWRAQLLIPTRDAAGHSLSTHSISAWSPDAFACFVHVCTGTDNRVSRSSACSSSLWQVMRFQQSSQGADKALDRDLQLPPGSFPAARCVGPVMAATAAQAS